MAKVKEVIEFLKTLNEDEELFIGYDDSDELRCALWTEQAIIDKVNEDLPKIDSEIVEINTALEVLANYDEDYHFSLIDLN